jgi:hypothetical protein
LPPTLHQKISNGLDKCRRLGGLSTCLQLSDALATILRQTLSRRIQANRNHRFNAICQPAQPSTLGPADRHKQRPILCQPNLVIVFHLAGDRVLHGIGRIETGQAANSSKTVLGVKNGIAQTERASRHPETSSWLSRALLRSRIGPLVALRWLLNDDINGLQALGVLLDVKLDLLCFLKGAVTLSLDR